MKKALDHEETVANRTVDDEIHASDELGIRLKKTNQHMITLTEKQALFFQDIRMNAYERRLKIQAPPGSGKTELCKRMALDFLVGTNLIEETKTKYLLLLTQSPSFARYVIESIVNQAVINVVASFLSRPHI